MQRKYFSLANVLIHEEWMLLNEHLNSKKGEELKRLLASAFYSVTLLKKQEYDPVWHAAPFCATFAKSVSLSQSA